MKKKNLLLVSIMVLSLCVLNQFANAQVVTHPSAIIQISKFDASHPATISKETAESGENEFNERSGKGKHPNEV